MIEFVAFGMELTKLRQAAGEMGGGSLNPPYTG